MTHSISASIRELTASLTSHLFPHGPNRATDSIHSDMLHMNSGGLQPHLHKVHFNEPPAITRKQCVDVFDNVACNVQGAAGSANPLSADCLVRAGLPSQVGGGPHGERVLPEVRELESQKGGSGSPGSASESASDRVEGESSHGGSVDSPSSVADAGSPLGSLVSRDVCAAASKRKRVAEPSPAELDAFRFDLAREYLRGFPSADFEDTLNRIITESYALEQWRFDHEVRRPIRPLVPGKVPSAALGAPPPVVGGGAGPESPGLSGQGLLDLQVPAGTASHPRGMDPTSSTPAPCGSTGGEVATDGLSQSARMGSGGQATAASASLRTPGQTVEGTQLVEESLQLKGKEAIKAFIVGSTALRGIEPATMGPTSKRVKLSTWDSSSKGEAREEEGKLVWPTHFRVKEVVGSFNHALPSLQEQDSKLPSSDYRRVPLSAVPDIGAPEYLLQAQPIPGWTGQRPTDVQPLGKQVAEERPKVEISVKTLREIDEDWRQVLSLSSVISHMVDTLDAACSPDPAKSAETSLVTESFRLARLSLDKLSVTAARNVACHTIWERHRAQLSHLDVGLMRLDNTDMARCRLQPIDSGTLLFGRGGVLHTDLIAKRVGERLATVEVRIQDSPKPQPFRSKGKSSRPKSSSGKSKDKPSKGKQSKASPKRKDKASKSSKASPKRKGKEDTKSKARWQNKSSRGKKGSSSKQE